MKKLEGKVAVITGGNSGIGFATAMEFKKHGAKVAISGRNTETLKEAERKLGGAIAARVDSANPGEMDEFLTGIAKNLGKIDVLFLNAGVGKFLPLNAMTEEVFDELMNVNFKGPYFTLQKALPHLSSSASVILNTSITNQLGMPATSAYAAAKAALRSLARTLSAEMIGSGVRVNAVCPGPISTPIYERLGLPPEALKNFQDSITQQSPMKRFGSPSEVASVALFLASSDSSYITGAEIAVDGGITHL